MDPMPEYSDIPFLHQVALQSALEMRGFSRNEDLVTCHVSEVFLTFPRPYFTFIKLLCYVNNEITHTWRRENKEDHVYWIS